MTDNTAMPDEGDANPDQAPETPAGDTYEVGYGKPPKHTRFKKGQSGNPGGRPRRFRNLATMFEDALNEKVTMVENGRRRQISKREAIAKWLINRAALQGDDQSIQILLRLMGQLDTQKELGEPPFVIIRRGGDALL